MSSLFRKGNWLLAFRLTVPVRDDAAMMFFLRLRRRVPAGPERRLVALHQIEVIHKAAPAAGFPACINEVPAPPIRGTVYKTRPLNQLFLGHFIRGRV